MIDPWPIYKGILAEHGVDIHAIEPLAGDVSSRRYARIWLTDDTSAVLAIYPTEILDAQRRFLTTTSWLADIGVRVPAVRAYSKGWMVVEDLGPSTLAEHAMRTATDWSLLAPYYRDALRQIDRFETLPHERVARLNPPLDEALLRRELEITWKTFFVPRQLTGDATTQDRLRASFDDLCRTLGERSPVVCHRDLTVRNLVPLPSHQVGILDHQDLRLGPPLYDLASLLNDTLFAPPSEIADDLPVAHEDFARVAAQRTLKAVGTYARSGRHANLIEPTFTRAIDFLLRVPETTDVAARLETRWRQALC
ncbi:MAG: phosphotransferase [Acidobacteriota bacterium]